MCNFYSTLVLPNGDVLDNDYTDSHEDLVRIHGLKRDTGREFVRVEMTPPVKNGKLDYADVDGYVVKVDEEVTPVWWEEVKCQAIKTMRRRVTRMLVTDKRDILAGGRYIILDGAYVGEFVGGRIVAIIGGTVNDIRGGTVNAIIGGTVNDIRGGTVNAIWGGTVNAIWGGTVNAINGGTVNYINGGTVNAICSGTVNAICVGTVNNIRGGTVNEIGKYATIVNDNRQKP